MIGDGGSHALGAALSLALSVDGARLVVGHLTGAVSVWDVRSGVMVKSVHEHKRAVTTVAFVPRGSKPGGHTVLSGGVLRRRWGDAGARGPEMGGRSRRWAIGHT